MNNEIQQEILSRLDVLGEKLGVGAEHLWQIFLVQAHIDAISTIIVWVIFVSFALGFTLYSRGKSKWTEYEDSFKTDDPSLAGILMVVGIVLAVASTIMVLALSSTILTQFLNPDYYAWQQISRILN